MCEVLVMSPRFSQINATKLNIPNSVAKNMVNVCILYFKTLSTASFFNPWELKVLFFHLCNL